MTPQEAINVLEKYKTVPRSEVVKEAYTMAISALEKQILKKPILDTIFPSGVKWYLCPTCNHNGIEKIGAYCHSCGQALDWGDSDA